MHATTTLTLSAHLYQDRPCYVTREKKTAQDTMTAQRRPLTRTDRTRATSMYDGVNDNQDVRVRLLHAVITYLHRRWPDAATLMPSILGSDFSSQGRIFVEIVQTLIDEGMITVEFFVIGGAAEPVARGVLLTRKGAQNRSSI